MQSGAFRPVIWVMTDSRHRRRGFTLAELLVVLGILLLIVAIVIPTVLHMRDSAGRQRCPSNLRQIGQAIQMYANENNGQFPRGVFDGTGGSPVAYTASGAPNPFLPGGPGPNDVTAPLFLLLRTQDLSPEVFVCPWADGARPWDFGGGGRTAAQASNFPGPGALTYSYANPYASPAVEKAGFKLGYTLTSDFALAADMNPGGAAVTSVSPTSPRQAISAANSRNHGGVGQNVLYADGHVEFRDTPFSGMTRTSPASPPPFRDNIYTAGTSWGAGQGTDINTSPVDPLDSVLLPTATDSPPK